MNSIPQNGTWYPEGRQAVKIHDISIPLCGAVASWPGDAPFETHWTMKRSEGATVNVSQIRMSVHSGTHTDAPFHFLDGAATIDGLALDPYLGPARVIDVRHRPRIRRQDLETIDLSGTPRLLFRTDAWTDHCVFPKSIPVMEADVPAMLAAKGVVLIGVDVPSVDALDSEELPVHHALGAHGIYILESLSLVHIAAGVYQLIALPLNLVGSDGAPVRAVLCE
jgi:arylformamidase